MRTLVLLVAAGLVATACSSTPTAESTASPSPAPTTASPSPTPTPTTAFPLTGETTEDPGTDRPVMSVKIDNVPAAQPHAGLEQADLVFEEIVEGGVTRLAALFHSERPSTVGPVRSARLVDVPLLSPFRSALVYSGARPEVTAALQAADGIGLVADSGPPTFTRAPGRTGSHDLMADTDLAMAKAEGIDEVAPVGEDVPLAFAEEVPSGGVDQGDFSVRMTTATTTGWQWDDGAGVFRPSRNGSPYRVTGEGRIGIANVVAILTGIGTGGCCDSAGNPYVSTQLAGSGDAVVWRDGQRFEATWRKASAGDHLQVVTADGELFPFAPGPTWYHLTAPSGAPSAPSTGSSSDG